MSAPENPPAFPRDERYLGHNGMTLRDYFAGQALAGSFQSNTDTAIELMSKQRSLCANSLRALYCYEIADAMLAARTKGGAA